jgi:DNA-3-methyladenine glycosylase II
VVGRARVTDLPAAIWTGGRRRLLRDPAFGPWARHIGPIRVPVSREDPFFYLARAIVYQQLAGAAARTIHGRFVASLQGDVTPERVLRARTETLRKAGLSRSKLAAIRDLADRVRSGDVELGDLEARTDDEVVKRLTLVRGIGPWTAHMYLMFRMHRPDVWPTGDLGVRTGFAKVHALVEPPTPKVLEGMGDGYRPWRSAAAFYCGAPLRGGSSRWSAEGPSNAGPGADRVGEAL